MTGLGLAVGIAVCAVILQALFAGYETGFVSTNPIRIRFLAEEENMSRARRLMNYSTRPDLMLTMLLIGTNLCTVGGTMAVTYIAIQCSYAIAGMRGIPEADGTLYQTYGELGAALLAAPVFLLFAEVIPKSVFRTHPNRLALALLPVVEAFYILFYPVAAPVAMVSRLLVRRPDGARHYLSPLMSSREDVRALVDESAVHGTIEPEEQMMIHSVINLQRKQAKEIMVPRIDIQAVPDTACYKDLLALLVESGRTRIPVYSDTIDTIVGVVNAHDVLLDAEPENQDISRFIRPVAHVPDTVKLDDLFEMLKNTKQRIAIVTDEYGGTDGLITIEDILEEIFGEIQDEHDVEESIIHQVGPRAYVVEARAPLEEVARAASLDIEDTEVETVGGWVMHLAGHIPAQGEVIKGDGFRLTVLDGGANYVSKIRLEVSGEAAQGERGKDE